MNRNEFICELTRRLDNLPEAEIKKATEYYEEIIGDRIEDGMSEEEAFAAAGDMDEIVGNLMNDMSFRTLISARVRESKKRSGSKTLWTVLVIVGSPIWLSLLVAFVCAAGAIYAALWAVACALWASVLALGVAGVAGTAGGIAVCFVRSPALGLCAVGAALVCGSLALFLIKPVFLATRGVVYLTAAFVRRLKSLFIIRREDENENK